MVPETELEVGSFDWAIGRLEEFRSMAKQYGFDVLLCICNHDKFANTEAFDCMWSGNNAALGMADRAKAAIMRHLDTEE